MALNGTVATYTSSLPLVTAAEFGNREAISVISLKIEPLKVVITAKKATRKKCPKPKLLMGLNQ